MEKKSILAEGAQHMKRFRSAIAGLLALLLFIPGLPYIGSGGGLAHAAEITGTGAKDVPTGTVLIKNKWKGNYLYETSDGIVRYGMTHPADASAHWKVLTDNGISRIQNEKTGHFITLTGNNGKEDSLKAGAASGAKDQWLIDTSSRNGYMVIRSATEPLGQLVIHEEQQLGYAQVSADINITFESPQWAFVPLNAPSPVRLESRMRPGQVMYEKDGKVLWGSEPVTNEAAQWYIEPGGAQGTLHIRNKSTGNYIKQNEQHEYGVFSAKIDLAKSALSDWIQEAAAGEDGAGYATFRNSGLTDGGKPLWLNPQFNDDHDVRSNNWPAGSTNAQWKIVPVSDFQPVRLAAYTDAQSPADFLYETAGGGLKHGAIADAADVNSFLWYLEDYDGHKRLRNAATGDYLSYAEGTVKALQVKGSLPADQWTLKESDDFDDYLTIGNVGDTGSYLSILGGGNAGAGTDNASLNAQWQLADPAAPVDNSEHYIRIQNGWQSFYWYESKEGLLKYGNMQEDGSDQWLVVKYNGRKLFKNRATGHYLNIAKMPDGHLQVSPLGDLNNVDPAYIWTGKNIGNSTYVISSVLDKEPNKQPEKYISLQNLTKYAEYGAINPAWGSPQWRFVPVTEKKQDLFRFKLQGAADGEELYLKDGPVPTPQVSGKLEEEVTDTGPAILNGNGGMDAPDDQDGPAAPASPEDKANTNDSADAADQADANASADAADSAGVQEPKLTAAVNAAPAVDDATVGQVTYGNLDLSDDSFVWQLQEIAGANGQVKIQNRGTGRYLSLQSFEKVIDSDSPQLPVLTDKVVYDVWASIKWYVGMDEQGDTTFKSGWGGHYLYSSKDANDYPVLRISRVDGISNRKDAHFTAEPAVIAPQPLPSEPVRLKNANTGEYLYENEHGVVLYGSPAANNGYSHWTLVDEGEGQYIVNRATGHYLTLNGDYSFLEISRTAPANGASAWDISLAPDAKNYTIRSLYGEYDDEYINIKNRAGYAEHGLYLTSDSSVQWSLEAADKDFITPDGEPRNTDTATPVQEDTNLVKIVPENAAGAILAEQDGQIVVADSAAVSTGALWRLQDFNGRKRIVNADSGHFLALDQDGAAIIAETGTSELAQWNTPEKLGYTLLQNADKSQTLTYNGSSVALGAINADNALWSLNPVPGDAVYAGAEAFRGDGVLRFAVHADTAKAYNAALGYLNNTAAPAKLKVEVNGLPQREITLAAGSAWTNQTFPLNLQAGMNTVSFIGSPAVLKLVDVDSLTIKNSINKAYRGATLPYVTYEAEDADTNAQLLDSSRKYRTVASEASGRQAVVLSNTGDYIEFTLAKPANALVLRYSIPDSQDGQGDVKTLSLYVNGKKQELTLTSKYAWEYGSYPWSNDPAQGSAHRFFDEIHAMIGETPAGATIRLVKEDSDTAASYTLDLMDMEQVAPALVMPDGFVSVTDFGATANDGSDDTAAFKQALAKANAEHTGVWFPAGSFNVGADQLDLDSALIRGAGMWHTTLNGAKFFGHGGTVGVYDLLIDGGINVRDDEAVTNAFHGAFGQGSVIQNVWIEHTKAGLWLTQPMGEKARTNGLYMEGLRIRNLMADGINFAVGTGNSMMEQSDIRYPGDDGIAMWSFTDPKLNDVNGTERTPSYNNTARFNTVSLPWLADNIVIFGGRDNKVQDNIVKDTVTNGAGIAVSTRFTAEPFQGTTIVERNTLLRTGSYDSGYTVNLGGLWLYAGEGNMKADIRIRNNTIVDSTYSGIIAHGNLTMDGVRLTDNVIDGAGTSGVAVTADMKGSLIADNLIIRGERMFLTANGASGFVIDERNKGISSKIIPFSAKLADGQTAPFTIAAGSSVAIQVVDPAGPDITSQATFSVGNSAIAAVNGNKLFAYRGGNTVLTVTVGGISRAYDLAVTGSTDSGSPGDSAVSPAASAPSTEAGDKSLQTAASGTAVIEVAAAQDGSVAFGAAALRAAAAASPGAVLAVTHDGAVYRIPLAQAQRVLDAAGLSGGVLEVQLGAPPAAEQAQLLAAAGKQGLSVKGAPLAFTVTVTDGKASVPAGTLGTAYAERRFAVDGALDPKTSVALLFDPAAGTFKYVPALFETVNGATAVTVKSSLPGGIIAVAQNPVSFGDTAGHWAEAQIGLLASKLIVNGPSAGSFAPAGNVSRAEFAAMLVRSLGLVPDASAPGAAFTDVPAGAWYASDAAAAAALGLVQGYADGGFRPNAQITREQMAVMAARALKLMQTDAPAAQGNAAFKDGDRISAWAQDAVAALVAGGIMNGRSADHFAPDQNTSRAEAAVILVRLLQAGKLLNP